MGVVSQNPGGAKIILPLEGPDYRLRERRKFEFAKVLAWELWRGPPSRGGREVENGHKPCIECKEAVVRHVSPCTPAC